MPRIGTYISRSTCRRLRLAAAAVLALGWAEGARARQVGANGPVALPEKPLAAVIPAPAGDVVDGAAESQVPSSLRDAWPVAPSPAAPAPAPLKASESRPLGKPNSLLSARPERAEPVEKDSSASLFSAIDPRSNDFTRVIGALAAVIGLILLARTLLKRYLPAALQGGGERPSGVIEILARYPMGIGRSAGRGQQLIVLKFARRILLVHQAGSTLSTLSEMTDRDEVASLLSRLEAGANAKSQDKFRAALHAFESEHDVITAQQSRAGAALAAGEIEIIDLTRTQVRGMSGTSRARRLLR
jgi:flagellar biogenesis protein FliO